ncbi:hypothetical protein pb186bvf_016574 [Paramecium bursaria]
MNQQSTILLRDIVHEKYEAMKKKLKENKNLVLPKNFHEFIYQQEFLQFLLAIYDYCQEVSRVETKQKNLEQQAKEKQNILPKYLSSEQDRINEKLKAVTEKYCTIIQNYTSNIFTYRDQNFFETLIYFIAQVLKKMFDGHKDFKFIEEEINRIFRTNCFNIIKRRHFEEDRSKGRGPKDKSLHHQKTEILEKLGKVCRNTKEFEQHDEERRKLIDRLYRISLHRQNNTKFEMMKEKSEIKPYFIKQTPCASINSRSPIIAMVFPSAMERLFQFAFKAYRRNKSLIDFRFG